MTDNTDTISDKQLADNVRAAADRLAAAWNAAADAGLTVDVKFIACNRVGGPLPNVIPNVTIRRVTTEDL